jgi:hypothetical protein
VDGTDGKEKWDDDEEEEATASNALTLVGDD